MKYKLAFGAMVFCVLLSSFMTPTVHADGFNQNRIIDDALFDDANSMTAAQIDAFLNGFSGSCISPNSGFAAIDPTGYNPTSGYQYGGYVTAGQVIYDAAQAYGINPEVLLTTLEKEQSLVTGQNNFAGYCNDGSQHKYAAAVGYGCPDSGTTYSYTGLSLYRRNGITVTDTGTTCVNAASKAGFSQQVIRAAWLLKFGEQRSKGNINWAVIKGSWDNSDDPQTCYGGPMTQGTWQRCPSGSFAYYDGYTTIDATAVHMDDGATAALYWYTPHFHGNQNFYNLYVGWFGNTLLPVAFKTASSPSVYVQTNGYKFYVPTISVLQDFGINSGSIQVISDATANSIPVPDQSSGLSSTLTTVVKSPSDTDSDGGAIYLINSGIRYQFTTPQQMTDFGFDASNISYLPLAYIQSINSGGNLSNYVRLPNYAIFQISGDVKKYILDGAMYASLNPSGALSSVNTGLLDSIPTGNPLTSTQALLGTSSGTIYLYLNNTFYYVPSPEILDCWGFMSTMGMSLYKLPSDTYIPSTPSATPLSCVNQFDSSTMYLLNRANRILVPSSYGFAAGNIDTNLNVVANKLPARSSSTGNVIQATNSPIVWYLENGVRKGIPSTLDLSLLGIQASQIDRINPGAVNALPMSGLKMGVGQVVRASDTGAVYVITTSTTKSWIGTPEDFIAFGYSWSSLMSFPSSVIDQFYTTSPTPLNHYLYPSGGGGAYLVDTQGCYGLNNTQLTAFGQPTSVTQGYPHTIFPFLHLVDCKNGSVYVKAPNSFTIYWVDAGQKHPISTPAALISHSGTSNPYIITVNQRVLDSLATGSTL